jgi:nucleotide-binding universal stress UspA family protein
MSTKKVLVPLDGSELSLQILPYLMRFLNPATNELILFYVASEPHHYAMQRVGDDDLSVYVDQAEIALEAEFYAEMLPHIRKLESAGFRVTTAVCFGKPTEEIEKYMQTANIDLIAMTTHGRTGLRRLRYGSVAEYILHHSTVPVMLYHVFAADQTPVTHRLETAVA